MSDITCCHLWIPQPQWSLKTKITSGNCRWFRMMKWASTYVSYALLVVHVCSWWKNACFYLFMLQSRNVTSCMTEMTSLYGAINSAKINRNSVFRLLLSSVFLSTILCIFLPVDCAVGGAVRLRTPPPLYIWLTPASSYH